MVQVSSKCGFWHWQDAMPFRMQNHFKINYNDWHVLGSVKFLNTPFYFLCSMFSSIFSLSHIPEIVFILAPQMRSDIFPNNAKLSVLCIHRHKKTYWQWLIGRFHFVMCLQSISLMFVLVRMVLINSKDQRKVCVSSRIKLIWCNFWFIAIVDKLITSLRQYGYYNLFFQFMTQHLLLRPVVRNT